VALKATLLGLLGLFDGFQEPKFFFTYFLLEEELMQNLIQVVSYFLEHL